MRQSFSSASCASGDSLWAVNTTLQCVVANAPAPFSVFPPIVLRETLLSLGGRLRSSKNGRARIKLGKVKVPIGLIRGGSLVSRALAVEERRSGAALQNIRVIRGEVILARERRRFFRTGGRRAADPKMAGASIDHS